MENKEKPKYQNLKEYIVSVIEDGSMKQNEKMYSENELAEKFAISRHTVRKAIGDLVNDGWLYRVQGKGTFVNNTSPNVSNGNKPSKIIGVMISFLNDYIFPTIVQGIEAKLASEGYTIFLSCTYNQHEKEKACLENLLSQNIDGLIVEATKGALPNPNIELYQKLRDKGVPVLFIHGAYNEFECSYLAQDDRQAGYIATKHLIDKGHRNIGGIFKFDYKQGHSRFEGFQKAINEAKFSASDNTIIWFDDDDLDYQLNKDINKKVAAMIEKSTAIVCYNDQIAVRLMEVIKNIGLNVPDDKSLISFDDSSIAVAVEPKLTTMAHPQEKLGIRAAQIMLDIINGDKTKIEEKMQPMLIIRDSVKDLGGF
jgi:GntR family transcriptional regulator of arabinose operon